MKKGAVKDVGSLVTYRGFKNTDYLKKKGIVVACPIKEPISEGNGLEEDDIVRSRKSGVDLIMTNNQCPMISNQLRY